MMCTNVGSITISASNQSSYLTLFCAVYQGLFRPMLYIRVIFVVEKIIVHHKKDMNMSLFAMFAIVLTIGEILYFAAAISLDLHAKSKKEEGTIENIPIGDKEDGGDVQPRTVTENVETGGFDVAGTSFNPVPEQISEADEQEEADKPEEVPSSATEETDADSGNPNADSEPSENQQETTSAKEESDDAKEEKDIIPSVGFIEEHKQEKDTRPFVEEEVFNPELVQPQYEVQQYIGNPANDALAQKIESVNQNMKRNTTLGNLFNSRELCNIIQNNVDSINIDKRDEYTQC